MTGYRIARLVFWLLFGCAFGACFVIVLHEAMEGEGLDRVPFWLAVVLSWCIAAMFFTSRRVRR